MDYTIDNYRDMAIEYRTTAMSVLSNIERKEQLIYGTAISESFREELCEEVLELRKIHKRFTEAEAVAIEKMEEMEKKVYGKI